MNASIYFSTQVSGFGREHTEKDQRYTISLCLSSYAENYWKAHSTTPILLSFARSPTFIGRHAHIKDVAIPTRQRRKTFGNQLTGPQLGTKNSKPWRNSVTSPKARHVKPVFTFPPQPEQMENALGQWKIMLVYVALERVRVEPHLRRKPHGLSSIKSA